LEFIILTILRKFLTFFKI